MLLLRPTILFTRVFQRYGSTASSDARQTTSVPTTDSALAPKEVAKGAVAPGPLQTGFTQFGGYKFDEAPPHQQFAALSKQQKWNEAAVTKNHNISLKAVGKQNTSPIDGYFLGYAREHGFCYNPVLSPSEQWRKLKAHMGWPKKEGPLDRKMKAEKAKKQGKMPNMKDMELDEEANQFFMDDKKMKAFLSARRYFRVSVGAEVGAQGQKKKKRDEHWGVLCKILGVNPVPRTIELCKTVLVPFHVNIYDMLESIRIYERTGEVKRPLTFRTERELGKYSRDMDRIFPREMAHENEVLRLLLRHIFSPAMGDH